MTPRRQTADRLVSSARGGRMTSQVTLPLWLALIISALAVWAAFDRILVPGVRYLMRRRFNRAIDELNTRLKLRIQPFKLAKRQALIDQLIFDPEVLRAIEEYAASNKVSREAAQARARDYAREIVPSFSAYAYFGIGTRLARAALSQGSFALRPSCRCRRAHAGDVPRGWADTRRQVAPAEAGSLELHGFQLRSEGAARRGIRASRHQLRPRDRRPDPGRGA